MRFEESQASWERERGPRGSLLERDFKVSATCILSLSLLSYLHRATNSWTVGDYLSFTSSHFYYFGLHFWCTQACFAKIMCQ